MTSITAGLDSRLTVKFLGQDNQLPSLLERVPFVDDVRRFYF